ncbi:MAG TPA: OFA family MFS transporter [Anaeromyxobacteraceae bacterium]
MAIRNRWAIAAGGTAAMACLGTVYSWSLFTQPLVAAFGWSTTGATLAFSFAIFFLGVGAVAGGRWQDRAGPRPVAVSGAVLWGLGNVLAGLGTARYGAGWLYLTYGVVGGLGLGLAYVTPVATVTKWFPDRRGLGSGLVVMGFGLGAFAYNLVLRSIPALAAAAGEAGEVLARRREGIGAALSADATAAVLSAFTLSGLVFGVVGIACAAAVRNPPTPTSITSESTIAADPEPFDSAALARGSAQDKLRAAGPESRGTSTSSPPFDWPPSLALRTPQFWALWGMLFLNVTAGILFISSAVPLLRELTGASAEAAVGTYGLIALANGAGRFFWGAVSDRLGRRLAYGLIYGAQVGVFAVVGQVHALPAVAALFAVVLLCYGGGFGTMPSLVADWFGTRSLGVNYGWILSAWGTAGLVGPLFVAAVKDATGSYTGALPVMAGVLAAAVILPVVTRRPARRT